MKKAALRRCARWVDPLADSCTLRTDNLHFMTLGADNADSGDSGGQSRSAVPIMCTRIMLVVLWLTSSLMRAESDVYRDVPGSLCETLAVLIYLFFCCHDVLGWRFNSTDGGNSSSTLSEPNANQHAPSGASCAAGSGHQHHPHSSPAMSQQPNAGNNHVAGSTGQHLTGKRAFAPFSLNSHQSSTNRRHVSLSSQRNTGMRSSIRHNSYLFSSAFVKEQLCWFLIFYSVLEVSDMQRLSATLFVGFVFMLWDCSADIFLVLLFVELMCVRLFATLNIYYYLDSWVLRGTQETTPCRIYSAYSSSLFFTLFMSYFGVASGIRADIMCALHELTLPQSVLSSFRQLGSSHPSLGRLYHAIKTELMRLPITDFHFITGLALIYSLAMFEIEVQHFDCLFVLYMLVVRNIAVDLVHSLSTMHLTDFVGRIALFPMIGFGFTFLVPALYWDLLRRMMRTVLIIVTMAVSSRKSLTRLNSLVYVAVLAAFVAFDVYKWQIRRDYIQHGALAQDFATRLSLPFLRSSDQQRLLELGADAADVLGQPLEHGSSEASRVLVRPLGSVMDLLMALLSVLCICSTIYTSAETPALRAAVRGPMGDISFVVTSLTALYRQCTSLARKFVSTPLRQTSSHATSCSGRPNAGTARRLSDVERRRSGSDRCRDIDNGSVNVNDVSASEAVFTSPPPKTPHAPTTVETDVVTALPTERVPLKRVSPPTTPLQVTDKDQEEGTPLTETTSPAVEKWEGPAKSPFEVLAPDGTMTNGSTGTVSAAVALHGHTVAHGSSSSVVEMSPKREDDEASGGSAAKGSMTPNFSNTKLLPDAEESNATAGTDSQAEEEDEKRPVAAQEEPQERAAESPHSTPSPSAPRSPTSDTCSVEGQDELPGTLKAPYNKASDASDNANEDAEREQGGGDADAASGTSKSTNVQAPGSKSKRKKQKEAPFIVVEDRSEVRRHKKEERQRRNKELEREAAALKAAAAAAATAASHAAARPVASTPPSNTSSVKGSVPEPPAQNVKTGKKPATPPAAPAKSQTKGPAATVSHPVSAPAPAVKPAVTATASTKPLPTQQQQQQQQKQQQQQPPAVPPRKAPPPPATNKEKPVKSVPVPKSAVAPAPTPAAATNAAASTKPEPKKVAPPSVSSSDPVRSPTHQPLPGKSLMHLINQTVPSKVLQTAAPVPDADSGNKPPHPAPQRAGVETRGSAGTATAISHSTAGRGLQRPLSELEDAYARDDDGRPNQQAADSVSSVSHSDSDQMNMLMAYETSSSDDDKPHTCASAVSNALPLLSSKTGSPPLATSALTAGPNGRFTSTGADLTPFSAAPTAATVQLKPSSSGDFHHKAVIEADNWTPFSCAPTAANKPMEPSASRCLVDALFWTDPVAAATAPAVAQESMKQISRSHVSKTPISPLPLDHGVVGSASAKNTQKNTQEGATSMDERAPHQARDGTSTADSANVQHGKNSWFMSSSPQPAQPPPQQQKQQKSRNSQDSQFWQVSSGAPSNNHDEQRTPNTPPQGPQTAAAYIQPIYITGSGAMNPCNDYNDGSSGGGGGGPMPHPNPVQFLSANSPFSVPAGSAMGGHQNAGSGNSSQFFQLMPFPVSSSSGSGAFTGASASSPGQVTRVIASTDENGHPVLIPMDGMTAVQIGAASANGYPTMRSVFPSMSQPAHLQQSSSSMQQPQQQQQQQQYIMMPLPDGRMSLVSVLACYSANGPLPGAIHMAPSTQMFSYTPNSNQNAVHAPRNSLGNDGRNGHPFSPGSVSSSSSNLSPNN